MGGSQSRRRIYILIGIGALICVLAFALAISRFQSVGELAPEENDLPIVFPTGGGRSGEVYIAPEVVVFESTGQTDVEPETQVVTAQNDRSWQDNIVNYSAESNAIVYDTPAPPSVRVSNYSIDDLPDLDLNINGTRRQIVQPPVVAPILSIPVTNPNPVPVAPVDFPSMERLRFSNCGSVTVPTGFGLALFTISAKSNPTVICLGEAIAEQSCGSNRATIESEGVEVGAVFVAKRPDDGVCSVGAPLTDDLVSMCSVEKFMDIGTGEDKTMLQWKNYFNEDPGKAFAELYFNNIDAFSNPEAETLYDCKVYEI
jgi:hypothetical protein